MTGFKSAWADPEHVRLASYRSPDDAGKPALRGPIPAFLDPWHGESVGLDGPRPQQDGRRGYARPDDYAAFRCSCQHICYRDDVPCGSCRFCPCENHIPAAAS
jgi:hypothetical protein